MTNDNIPICMTEEYWANSQLSIARYYGRIKAGGHEYVIVNKDGMDVFFARLFARNLIRRNKQYENLLSYIIKSIPIYPCQGRYEYML